MSLPASTLAVHTRVVNATSLDPRRTTILGYFVDLDYIDILTHVCRHLIKTIIMSLDVIRQAFYLELK